MLNKWLFSYKKHNKFSEKHKKAKPATLKFEKSKYHF